MSRHVYYCTNGKEEMYLQLTMNQVYEVMRDGYVVTMVK